VKGRGNLWLLLAVVLCAASVWAGLRGGGAEADGESAAPLPSGDEPAAAIHLRVLNGTDRAGLARDLALSLGPAGCVVVGVGNAPADPWPRSLLVNRRLAPNRAEALARRLGGLAVVREWDSRAGEDAVLVLGADWNRVRQALDGVAAAN
jgi:hypothetical protein